ncbi:hypothetical protein CJD36_005310 [Flavipsychrobacter stenotrophus]|uniref:Uncharacterized protein n=1 Tax=Flavipsychrobacter stenotrophus TaxID=2077091 RepID=A0A2S7SXA7_9BACT|nr:hypothetical protein [Flavipsychrobacter stenotrophus]PQJ11225.1 hypothetical protein CJD36_005310 [Flavipsychrobacter stenotrophus]
MKQIVITIAALFIALATFAQSDTLHLHNGKNIIGTVLKVGEHTVTFRYMHEDVEQVMGKYAVNSIVFGQSGRQQDVTPKLSVNGEQDWEHVMVVESADEIAGLMRVDEIRGKTAFINYRTGAGSDQTALKKLKKEAASKGCAFVLMTSDKEIDRKSASGGSFGQVQSIKRGVAYSY